MVCISIHCHRKRVARIIWGGLHPDHSTGAQFVGRNTGAVLALLPESVKACARQGPVSPEFTTKQLDAQISELEA